MSQIVYVSLANVIVYSRLDGCNSLLSIFSEHTFVQFTNALEIFIRATTIKISFQHVTPKLQIRF